MQHSQNQRAAKEEDKTDGHRKRKLQHVRPTSTTDERADDTNSAAKQQTISELFQQKPASANVSPKGSKRIKPNPAAGSADQPSSPPRSTTTTDSPRSTSSAALPAEKMYSFPSKRVNGSNVIDLTKTPSPTPSPARNAATNNSNGRTFSHKPNFNPNTGAKQLVVKNLRKTPRTDPKEYFNQVWGWLDDALAKVFNGDGGAERIDFSLETLYRGVENVCRQGHAAELAAKLHARCARFVEEGLRTPLVERAGATTEVDLLRAVLGAWRTWMADQVCGFLPAFE